MSSQLKSTDIDNTTDETTGETTCHPTKQPKDGPKWLVIAIPLNQQKTLAKLLDIVIIRFVILAKV
jgi:hypothetical protein